MYIALDAMGGDYAPSVVIEGAALALADFPELKLILVGHLDKITPWAEKFGLVGHDRVKLFHAEEAIGMDEPSTIALRKKKNSSISVCADLVAQKEAVAVVSAGHTGAAVAVSTIKLRTVKGIDRPAIATVMPAVGGHFILLDAGANVDCKPENLAQFAIMGEAYARLALKIEHPRIGLLSVGGEDVKGSDLTKEAFKMLSKMPINFIGNIEGHNLFSHRKADVVVTDGFTGNVLLKSTESLAEATFHWIKEAFMKNTIRMAIGQVAKPIFKELKEIGNYEEAGGAPLLGLNGVCIIGHGASTPRAIRNACRVAHEFVKADINTKISDRVAESGVATQKV